tara:strand:- start:256 stop:474 length:219 start_codon:yes stop_codon:yes gene_type:complete
MKDFGLGAKPKMEMSLNQSTSNSQSGVIMWGKISLVRRFVIVIIISVSTLLTWILDVQPQVGGVSSSSTMVK